MVRVAIKTYSQNLDIIPELLTSKTVVKDTASDFIEKFVKEVNGKPKQVRERFYKILTATYLIALPSLIPMNANAQTQAVNLGVPMIDKANSLEILPPEIVTILLQLVVAAGVIGVVFAILCLMVAGGYRMIGQSDKARNWSTDIIKGLGQVLLAPVIILLLVTLVSMMFKKVPGLSVFF